MKNLLFNIQRFGVISNSAINTVITGIDDQDSVVNSGNVVNISLGDGNDTIKNTGNIVIIQAGDGDNKINNEGENVLITTAAAICK